MLGNKRSFPLPHDSGDAFTDYDFITDTIEPVSIHQPRNW